MMYNRLRETQYIVPESIRLWWKTLSSSHHAILDLVNQIQINMDQKKYTCGIFIDLQETVDTVNHSILLGKLQHYGIRGIVNDVCGNA